MTERMIEVPMSQLETWQADLKKFLPPGTYAVVNEINALLWEATLSAESLGLALLRAGEFQDEPIRIEDMAPGTTFTAIAISGMRHAFTRSNQHAGGYVLTYGGSAAPIIDPSTIRDVTPPKEI